MARLSAYLAGWLLAFLGSLGALRISEPNGTVLIVTVLLVGVVAINILPRRNAATPPIPMEPIDRRTLDRLLHASSQGWKLRLAEWLTGSVFITLLVLSTRAGYSTDALPWWSELGCAVLIRIYSAYRDRIIDRVPGAPELAEAVAHRERLHRVALAAASIALGSYGVATSPWGHSVLVSAMDWIT